MAVGAFQYVFGLVSCWGRGAGMYCPLRRWGVAQAVPGGRSPHATSCRSETRSWIIRRQHCTCNATHSLPRRDRRDRAQPATGDGEGGVVWAPPFQTFKPATQRSL